MIPSTQCDSIPALGAGTLILPSERYERLRALITLRVIWQVWRMDRLYTAQTSTKDRVASLYVATGCCDLGCDERQADRRP